MVNIFNETISNILNNYILHEAIICNDQDPPWINNKVKKEVQEKNQLFRRVKSNINNGTLSKKLQCLQNKLTDLIVTAKRQYYTRISMKLMGPTTSAKTYWSILKRCLNDKRIPCIPPLFHDNKFVTDFKKKAELFNSFFSKQCSIIDYGSKLPFNLVYHTNEKLSHIVFNSEDIGKVISGLDLNKAHRHDMISIRMPKMCGKSIHKPSEYTSRAPLNDERFPSEWQKTNIVPIFEYLIENSLITENQSEFKPGDSCIN